VKFLLSFLAYVLKPEVVYNSVQFCLAVFVLELLRDFENVLVPVVMGNRPRSLKVSVTFEIVD
jgi:hypothetical protein